MENYKNEELKRKVKNFWDKNPCGAKFHIVAKIPERPIGTKEFFEEFDTYRFNRYKFLEKILRYNEYKGKKVLEIGVGMGSDIARYALAGAEVVGIDLTPSAIELCRQRFKLFGLKRELQVADAENLPFEDAIFDLVVSIGVLHHTPDTRRAIKEIYRVLKPKGEAIVMLYYKNSIRYRLKIPLLRIFRKKWRGMSNIEIVSKLYDGEDNPLGKVYSKREIRKMFREFSTLKMEAKNFHPREFHFSHFIYPFFRLKYLHRILEKIGTDIYITARK